MVSDSQNMYRESYVGPVQDGHAEFHIFGSDFALITADKLKMYVVSRGGQVLWYSINRGYCRLSLCTF